MASSESIGEAQQDTAEPGPALGERLRSAREAQDLSIDDVAAELRISAPSLLALEESRFDALGPRVFAKGYLKQYGARLGLDVSTLAADFERAAGQAGVVVAPSKTIRLRDERQIMLWVIAALVLAGLIAFLVLWWIRQAGPVELSAQVESLPATEVPATELPPVPEAVVDEEAVQEATRAAGIELAASERSAVADDTGDAAGPEVGAGEPDAGEPDTDAVDTGAVAVPVLEVRFVEDSWAEITAGDGERLFYNLGEAGTAQRFAASPELILLFGNAAGVELSIDGRPVAIPGSPRPGQVARLSLGALID